MQNKPFWVLALALMIGEITAGPVTLPKIRYDRTEQRAPEITVTGSWEKIPSARRRGTPADTLAARVSEKKYDFKWKPSPDKSRILPMADLPDALMSEDGSLLLLVERIGGRNSHNSTRLVMIDIDNRRICGSVELPERRISSLLLIPGTPEKIIAVQEAQSAFNSEHRLLLIDLEQRAVTAESAVLPHHLTALATDGKSFYLAVKQSQEILEGKIAGFSGGFVRHEARFQVKNIFCFPGTNTVAALGEGRCEYLSCRPGVLFVEHSLTLPSGFNKAWMLGIPRSKNGIVAVNSAGKGIYISPDGTMEIPGRWGCHGCVFDGEQIFLSGVNQIDMKLLTFPGAEVSGTYQPNSLPPRNRNNSRFFFARKAKSPQLIQVDERGNVFQITVTGRRGRKKAVLLVDKNGVR